MLKLFISILIAKAYITYDTWYNSELKNCYGISSVTTTIPFSDSFQNIPQVFTQLYQMSVGNQNPNEVRFEILAITTTCSIYSIILDFQAKLSCPKSGGAVTKYYFDWLAIDSTRVQVIRPSRQTTVTSGTIYTHSHTLQKAEKAIVILDSFSFTGSLDFYLQVDSVTATEVKIQLINYNSNLVSVGYSILIGTRESFFSYDLTTTDGGTDLLGEYTISEMSHSLVYYPFSGFSWDGSNSIRIIDEYQHLTDQYVIRYSTASGTYMTSVTLQGFQIFKHIIFPYYVSSYRVSKQFGTCEQDTVQVSFLELNQHFSGTADETFYLSSSQTLLTVLLEILLPKGKVLEGFFLKCNECGNENKYLIRQTYYSQTSLIKFTIKLAQYISLNTNIILSMSSSYISIYQNTNQIQQFEDNIYLELNDE